MSHDSDSDMQAFVDLITKEVEHDSDFNGASRFTVRHLLCKPYFRLFLSASIREAFEAGRQEAAQVVSAALAGAVVTKPPSLKGKTLFSSSDSYWTVISDLGTSLEIQRDGWPEGAPNLVVAYWSLVDEGWKLSDDARESVTPLPSR